jgi:hypothetical protein
VPAAYYWSPGVGSTDASVPSNWLKGPGVPYAVWDRPPGPLDVLVFDGDVSDAHCDIPPGDWFGLPAFEGVGDPPPPPEREFDTISLIDGYAGRVDMEQNLRVERFEITSGAVRQADSTFPTAAGTLTVLTRFDWTGGTINSGNRAGQLNLAPGATGLAEPDLDAPIDGTVQLGSTHPPGRRTDPDWKHFGSTGGHLQADAGRRSFCRRRPQHTALQSPRPCFPLSATNHTRQNRGRWGRQD